MRYCACIEYDGTNFSGWQAQKHDVRTVQEVLEAALSRVADHSVSVITAGRTDAGVHATHQVIHFESDANRTDFAWCHGANRFLDHDVRVHWVRPIKGDFHARFSAVARSYRFIIHNNTIKTALYRHYSSHEHRELNSEWMLQAGQALLGKHDFSSFRAAGCQASSPVRTMLEFSLGSKDQWLWFDVKANAFLQHMVRNIAGALIEIGCGERDINWIEELLEVKDRTKAGVTAPPNGLYLVGVDYPKEYSLPSTLKTVAFWPGHN